eukprot:Em0021g371a
MIRNDSQRDFITGLSRPQAIAFTHKGQMLVTECNSNKVTLREKEGGDVLLELGTPLAYPSGVAVDEDDNIYVTDKNSGVTKFDPHGALLRSTHSRSGYAPGEFRKALGIVVVNDKVYVCDGPNHRIEVFDRHTLNFLDTFGSRGDGLGAFNVPFDITADSAGNLYVADHFNHRIQVFNSNHEPVRCIGSEGDKPGLIHSPQSVALDPSQMYLYIAEGGRNYRVSVFKTTGEFVTVFNNNGYAVGLAVDNEDSVYVCDVDNNRIAVLKIDH